MLVSEHGIDTGDAAVIAAMAGGSLSKALRLHQNHWITRRYWLIKELESLPGGSINRLLAFADQLAKNKADLPDALEVLKSWLRDLTIAKLHPGRMRHHDLASDLEQVSQTRSLHSLLSNFEIIQSTHRAIHAGTNIRLAIESMMLKLRQA
jgi:DNA polymerase-3 subunit delta'